MLASGFSCQHIFNCPNLEGCVERRGSHRCICFDKHTSTHRTCEPPPHSQTLLPSLVGTDHKRVCLPTKCVWESLRSASAELRMRTSSNCLCGGRQGRIACKPTTLDTKRKILRPVVHNQSRDKPHHRPNGVSCKALYLSSFTRV